jgi:DNA-directed RNA polymerase beta' subunit
VRVEPTPRPTPALPHEVLERLLGRRDGDPPLRSLTLSLRTPDELRARTAGEVLWPETLDRETFLPVEGGLFCERVFGALALPDAARGERAVVADHVGGDVASRPADAILPASGRVARFGRVTLAAPVVHPFASGRPEWAAALVLAGHRPEHWRLEVLPVLPPDLRPMRPVPPYETPRFAVTDATILYREVVAASRRLARVQELRVPPSLVGVERDRLGQAVAQLVDNAHPGAGPPALGVTTRTPLVSLAALIDRAGGAYAVLSSLDAAIAAGRVRSLALPLGARTWTVLAALLALGVGVDLAPGAGGRLLH